MYTTKHQPDAMNKLIIRYDDYIDILDAINYAASVINQGRVSGDNQFCYHSIFASRVHVSAFKPSIKTDTLVVYKEPSNE